MKCRNSLFNRKKKKITKMWRKQQETYFKKERLFPQNLVLNGCKG